MYIIEDLNSAREFLKLNTAPIIVTNPKGSIKYYGMVVLDYMFKSLRSEFPHVIKIVVNVDEDIAGLFAAIKLGYKDISYSGDSAEAKRLLSLIS